MVIVFQAVVVLGAVEEGVGFDELALVDAGSVGARVRIGRRLAVVDPMAVEVGLQPLGRVAGVAGALLISSRAWGRQCSKEEYDSSACSQ